jgi:hypothetical protein
VHVYSPSELLHVQLSDAGIVLNTFAVGGTTATVFLIGAALTVAATGVAAMDRASTLVAMVTNAVRTRTDLVSMVFLQSRLI